MQSVLSLVDLAGSERVKKSLAVGRRLDEAIGINGSLTALGRTIAALVEERPHVPYYDSRLTMLLKSSLGGNARTQILVCCSGDHAQGEETLQSLRFGERCGMVTNRTVGCAESLQETVRELENAIRQSRQRLKELRRRGKTELPAYSRLQDRLASLQSRAVALSSREHPVSFGDAEDDDDEEEGEAF